MISPSSRSPPSSSSPRVTSPLCFTERTDATRRERSDLTPMDPSGLPPSARPAALGPPPCAAALGPPPTWALAQTLPPAQPLPLLHLRVFPRSSPHTTGGPLFRTRCCDYCNKPQPTRWLAATHGLSYRSKGQKSEMSFRGLTESQGLGRVASPLESPGQRPAHPSSSSYRPPAFPAPGPSLHLQSQQSVTYHVRVSL